MKQRKRHASWWTPEFVSVELFKVQKYPKTRKILKIFWKWQLNLRFLKTRKGHGKNQGIWRAQKSTKPEFTSVNITEVVFTLCRAEFAPAREPYRVGLLFTRKVCDFGGISVTERSSAAPISTVEHHISDRFCVTPAPHFGLVWTGIWNVAAANK